MERDSLGLIETSGLVAAIEAADAGSKAANVSFRGYERARAGLITVVFLGGGGRARSGDGRIRGGEADRNRSLCTRDCPARSATTRSRE